MSEVKHAYFIAKGRSLEAVLAWKAKRDAAMAAYGAIFEKMGIRHANGTRTGHTFLMEGDGQPKAPGLRLETGSRITWVFDRKTPEGKALAKAWGAIYAPGLGDLRFGSDALISGMHMYHPNIDQVGEAWIIGVPYHKPKDLKAPWDAEAIKTSEFWAMKEAIVPAQAEA